MARAKDVREGQVWTAKVSGKDTKVQIVSRVPAKAAGGRERFQYKNLATGRMATGTAGKLRSKLSDGGPPGGVPDRADPAPPPLPRTRARPVRRASVPAGRTSPTVAELELDLPPVRNHARPRFPRAPALPADYQPAPSHPFLHNPAPPEPLGFPVQASLPSLRAPRPRPTHRPTQRPARRPNPTRYPSPAARSASEAIAASGAQTIGDVLRAVQAWARRAGAPPYSRGY